jgi:hypothetical protein
MLIDPFSTNRVTSAIIGGAIRVHKATGPGLLESVYFPCLLFEVRQSGLAVVTQWPIPPRGSVTGMTATLLPDPLWDLVEPFLPSPDDGHRVVDRASRNARA